MKTRTSFVTALLGSVLLTAFAGGADAGMIKLKVTSGGKKQVVSATYSPTGVTQIFNTDIIHGVGYDAEGEVIDSGGVTGLALLVDSVDTVHEDRTVKYRLTATGLTALPDPASYEQLFFGFNAVKAKNEVSSALLRVFFDDTDKPFGRQTLIYDSSTLPGGSCGSASFYFCPPVTPAPTTTTTPFSLTEILTITYQKASFGRTVENTAVATFVPEPGSLALLVSGLLMAGGLIRRRRVMA